MRVRHENNGACPKCKLIMKEYSGLHDYLRAWFEELQRKHPAAHVSCAGRGREEQNRKKREGKSKASYGRSAHNYNCALDIFEMQGDQKNIYEKDWFQKVLKPSLTDKLYWYGEPDSPFYELPHVQVKNWKELVAKGRVKLVE